MTLPSLSVMGSIPACAGEPDCADADAAFHAVYPRVCGGTIKRLAAVLLVEGLSPRVRGNPSVVPVSLSAARSIPACAGEPPIWGRGGGGGGVYPRVCGGTHSLT